MMKEETLTKKSKYSDAQIIAYRGQPLVIRVDRGLEYVSGRLQMWAEKAGIGGMSPMQKLKAARSLQMRPAKTGDYH